jgi:hypothetical protein
MEQDIPVTSISLDIESDGPLLDFETAVVPVGVLNTILLNEQYQNRLSSCYSTTGADTVTISIALDKRFEELLTKVDPNIE